MTTLQDIHLPAQARATYKLLLADNNLTAAQIGEKLGVTPNAIYRSLETLRKFGCIVEQDTYPATFKAIAPSESVERFLLLSREGFLSTFDEDRKDRTEDVQINFIKDHQTILNRYMADAKKARKEINAIISGIELPDDVYFANLQSVRRGVRLRIIIQRYDETNKKYVKNLLDDGIAVRHSPVADVRFIAIDRKIIHQLFYDQKEQLSDFGINITYGPFAEMLSKVFDEKWEEAREISELTHF